MAPTPSQGPKATFTNWIKFPGEEETFLGLLDMVAQYTMI